MLVAREAKPITYFWLGAALLLTLPVGVSGLLYALWAGGGPQPAPEFYFDRALGIGLSWLALWLFAFGGTLRHRRWGAGLALFLAGVQTLASAATAFKLPYSVEAANSMAGMFVVVYAALLTGVLTGVCAVRAFRTPTGVFDVAEDEHDGLLIPEPLGRAKLALMSGVLLLLPGLFFLAAGYVFAPGVELGADDGQHLGTDESGVPVTVNWRRKDLPAMGFSIELPDEPFISRHNATGGAAFEVTVSTEYLLMSAGSKAAQDVPEGKRYDFLWNLYHQMRVAGDSPFEEAAQPEERTHKRFPALVGEVTLKENNAPGQVMLIRTERRVIVFFGFTHKEELQPVIERSRKSIRILE